MEYETALVCLNGHTINDRLSFDPKKTAKFCADCGESTISQCPQCRSPIRGVEYEPAGPTWREARSGRTEGNGRIHHRYRLGLYCHECGKPYPWTQQNIEAALKVLEESSDISDVQKGRLKESVPDLMVQTPRTALAVERFQSFLKDPVVFALWTNILGNLATEPVKKLLGIG